MVLTIKKFIFSYLNKDFFKIKIAIITLFFCHLFFYYNFEHVKPNIHIIPNLPSKASINALSLGDKQFYFRILGMKIQNAGDSFGRFSPLKNYDYNKLYLWFTILDTLDHKSNLIPSLAGFYYTNTQNKSDTIHLAKYLLEHSRYNISEKWWWMYHASFIAHHFVKDKKMALEIAYELANNYEEHMPFWVKQLPAFIHNQLGESCEAYFIIIDLIDNSDKLTPKQMGFMNHFIKKRIKDLKNQKFDPRSCQRKNHN